MEDSYIKDRKIIRKSSSRDLLSTLRKIILLIQSKRIQPRKYTEGHGLREVTERGNPFTFPDFSGEVIIRLAIIYCLSIYPFEFFPNVMRVEFV